MKKIAIMTDNIACIGPEMAQKFGIGIIPYHAVMDGKSYSDSEIDMERLYVNGVPATIAVHNGEGLIGFGFYSGD